MRYQASAASLHDRTTQSAFFREHLLVHTHVARSSGTSLIEAIAQLFGPAHIHDLRTNELPPLACMNALDKAKIWLLTGHFWFGRVSPGFGRRKIIYIACVREPVERFLSYYDFVLGNPDHADFSFVRDKSPEQIIWKTDKKHEVLRNDMSRTLGIKARRQIAARLEKDYLIVTPQQRVDELIRCLYRVFGDVNPQTFRHNALPSVRTTYLEPKARRLFLARNSIDVALYDYVNLHFDRWLCEFEHRLHKQSRGPIPRFEVRPRVWDFLGRPPAFET